MIVDASARYALTFFTVLALTTGLLAQEAKVFAVNSSNNRILAVSFDPPGTRVLNTDANQRASLRGLAVLDAGVKGIHLVVCDTLRGEVLFYENSLGKGQVISSGADPGHPARPDGLSLDFSKHAFLVSSGPGDSQQHVAEVWVIRRDPQSGGSPGGYQGPPGLIDREVEVATVVNDQDVNLPVEELEQTLAVKSSAGLLSAGDLLVLASEPAALLRYPASAVQGFLDALKNGGVPAELTPDVIVHPPEASVAADRRFPEGSSPNGMEFSPDGNLLICALDGRILIYRPDGTRRDDGAGFVDFAQGLGQGKFRIAVGPQDGAQRAFVSDRNGGEILRFTIANDGTGLLDASVADGVQFPVGIATTTSNTVLTPSGTLVTVIPTNVFESTFEEVVTPGFTNASVLVFEDPREKEASVPEGEPLHRALSLSEIDAGFPAVEIPAYVRSFRRGDPELGIPTFILVVADTSARFDGLIDSLTNEAAVLGYEPDCDDPDLFAQQRVFWSPDADDPVIIEGPTFIDITVGCGTARGLSQSFSFFLFGARDTRPLSTIADSKLDSLVQIVTSSTCIRRNVQRALQRHLDKAIRSFEEQKFGNSILALQDFAAQVEKSPGAFLKCEDSLPAELQARALSAIFMLGKL